MEAKKTIALVAHDNRKKDMIEWVEWNSTELLRHDLICTGTTGKLIEEAIHFKEGHASKGLKIAKLKSGPLGGDQQLGAMIAEGKVDMLIFFWDPMEQQPHDVDIKALLRIAVLYNIPTASNRSTADFIISSPLLTEVYQPKIKNYSEYLTRSVDL
ncbi:MAG TPA: methylglyoxal synthase [Williamwhitmania sp.]|nr:methylglyoxal synthase [Williamwhitmania sp.]